MRKKEGIFVEIVKTRDGTAVMLSLNGWLDTLSAPEFEAALKALDADVTDLVLDFEGLGYISSSGLRQIVLAQRMMSVRGSLTIIGVSEEIADVLRMAGLSERLNIIS